MFFYAMLLQTIVNGIIANTKPYDDNLITCTKEHGIGHVVFNHLRDFCRVRAIFQRYLYEHRQLHHVLKYIEHDDGLWRDPGWNINFL